MAISEIRKEMYSLYNMDILKSLLQPKPKKNEAFVDEPSAQSIVGTIYVVIGCMLLSVTLTVLMYWAYNKNVNLFAGILWTLVLLYAAGNVTFIGLSKERLQPFAFRFFIALHSVMGILSMGLLVFYFVKGSSVSINASHEVTNHSYGTPSPPEY